MSEQWRADFERLCECYGSFAALADQLGFSRSHVQKVQAGTEEPSEGFREAVTEHREQIKSEHTVAASMDATFQQAMGQCREAISQFGEAETQMGRLEAIQEIEKTLDRTEAILSDQRQQLCG